MMGPKARLLLAAVALLAIGCVTPYDYTLYRAHMPRSILVLPPMNESLDANAPYSYITTVTRPLAERGYYVFPVAVVDDFMKDNGLPTPFEMHSVPISKIGEIIGPDAVLYITIEKFAQEYIVLSSNTVVKVRARLVDVASETVIWEGQANAVQSSGGSGNLIADVIVAAVEQVVDSTTNQTHEVSKMANQLLIYQDKRGMLVGPRHPEFGKVDE